MGPLYIDRQGPHISKVGPGIGEFSAIILWTDNDDVSHFMDKY